MTNRTKVKFVRTWSAVAGLTHLLAAVLLVWSSVLPGQLPSLLPVAATTPPETTAILSWICTVLVSTMGLAYLSVVVGDCKAGVIVWNTTALIHGSVAIFLIWRIDTGDVTTSWFPRILPSLVMAVMQMVVVRADWWDDARKWKKSPSDRNGSNDSWN